MRWTIAAALAGVVLAACGGGESSNGLGSKSASDIVRAAAAALQNAKSVHIYGTVATSEGDIGLNLHILQGKGEIGSVAINGSSAKLIGIGSTLYMNMSAVIGKRLDLRTGAPPPDRWLRVNDTGHAQLAVFVKLATFNTQLAKVLAAAAPNHLKRGAASTIYGEPVIAVNGRAIGGTLYVAASGAAYPVLVRGPSAKAGAFRFDDWNAPVTLTAPAHALDITHFWR